LYASVPVAVVDQSVQDACYDPTVHFTTYRLGGTLGLSVMVKWAVDQGAKKIGFVGPNIPGFGEFVQKLQVYAESLGVVMLVKSAPAVPTAADIDQALVSFKEEGIDTLIPQFQPDFMPLVLTSAEAVGLGPKDIPRFLGATADASATNLTFRDAQDNAYGVSFTQNFEDDTPAIRKAKNVLESVDLEGPLAVGVALKAYNSIALLEQALKRVKGQITRASLIKALGTMRNVKVPLTPGRYDLTDPANNPEAGEAYQIVDGKYVLTTKSIIVDDLPK
jgi:Periplasmic binding protein